MKKTAILILVVLAAAGFAQADRTIEESRPLDSNGRVEIENVCGRVTVEGWSEDRVSIEGRLEDGVKEVDISSGGGRLSIEVEQDRRSGYCGEADLTVKIPVGASLFVECVAADISVDGVEGELDLESVSGHVEVSGDSESLEAASVSGNVIATSTAGRSDLESVSGNIIVRQAMGRLEAAVVSGKIEVEGGLLDSFSGETVSGTIYCAAAPTERGRFSMETMSGTIDMVVPADVNADFHIETYSGSIKNEIGPAPIRTDKYGPGKELRFTAGSGGAKVTIESFSGSVKLRTD